MKSIVAIVKCPDYIQSRVDESVDKIINLLGGIDKFVRKNDTVLIKPNLLRNAPPEAAITTHPAVIRRIIEQVIGVGGKPVVGDSPSFGATKKIAEQAGIAEVAREFGVEVIDLNKSVKIPGKAGQSLRNFKLARAVLDSDVVINVPKLKVHQQMQLSAAIKNTFGCAPGKLKTRLHLYKGQDKLTFAKMILEYYELVSPKLTIVDGIIAMERFGPGSGDPYPLGILTGGVDCVAMDRIHCEIIGMPANELELLISARELEIGETEIENIELVGESLDSVKVSDFKLSRQAPVGFTPIRVLKSIIKHIWIKMRQKYF
ncbi:DUF362 domain-containing protein [bacterium]|nr:DUF362 domain-containing protein [bacterium]